MPTAYRQFLIDSAIHERLVALRTRVSVEFFHLPNQLGIGTLIGILLDHAENVPPDYDWLKSKAESSPKRGRPRTSDPSKIPPTKKR